MKKVLLHSVVFFMTSVLVSSCQKDAETNTSLEETAAPKTVLDSLAPLSNNVVETRSSVFRWRLNMTGKTFNYYSFSRQADLLVTLGIKAVGGANFNNGVNPYDVGIVSGMPVGTPSTGAIWYGTNTAMCSIMNIGCNVTPQNAALDLAYVKWLNSNTLQIDVDGRFINGAAYGNSITGFLNIFNATGQFNAAIYRIISGRITLTFQTNGSVTGQIAIKGSSMWGYQPVDYVATFTGTRY